MGGGTSIVLLAPLFSATFPAAFEGWEGDFVCVGRRHPAGRVLRDVHDAHESSYRVMRGNLGGGEQRTAD
jgi:hypothetical protein